MLDNSYKDLLNLDLSNPAEVNKALERLANQTNEKRSKIEREVTKKSEPLKTKSNLDNKRERTVKSKVPKKNESLKFKKDLYNKKEQTNNKNKSNIGTKNRKIYTTNDFANIDLSDYKEVNSILDKLAKQANLSKNNFTVEKNIKDRDKRSFSKTNNKYLNNRNHWEKVKKIEKATPKERKGFFRFRNILALAIVTGAVSGLATYNYVSDKIIEESQRLEQNVNTSKEKQKYLRLGEYNSDYYDVDEEEFNNLFKEESTKETTNNNYDDYGDR